MTHRTFYRISGMLFVLSSAGAYINEKHLHLSPEISKNLVIVAAMCIALSILYFPVFIGFKRRKAED